MDTEQQKLPLWANTLLRLVVHPSYHEEVEGDLIEKYYNDIRSKSKPFAQAQLVKGLLSLMRINLIFNLNQINMTWKSWMYFGLISILLLVAAISPFLPGQPNDITHELSRFSQMIGYLGLAFVPFGFVWLIVELRNKKGQVLNKWTNGFYPALLVLAPVFIFIPLQTIRSISTGTSLDLWPLVIIGSIITMLIFLIYKLKNKTSYKFNAVPVYIVFLPFITILTSKLGIEAAAKSTRGKVIELSMPVVKALDDYKSENGSYPDNLELLVGNHLDKLPDPKIMGVRSFYYEKQNDAFQLSFEQLWHWNATEVVFYSSPGFQRKKYNYEEHTTAYSNWKYHMAD
jgi:hypothetical protein